MPTFKFATIGQYFMAVRLRSTIHWLRQSDRAKTLLGVAVLLASVLGYASYMSGNISNCIPYLVGRRLFVLPSRIDLGQVKPEIPIELAMTVRNASSTSISLLGLQTSCVCITSKSSYPLVVPTGGVVALTASFVPPKENNRRFQLTIKILSENVEEDNPTILVEGTTSAK